MNNGADVCRTTVVIPNFNGIKYLKDCLSSLLAGSVVPEIIVVDNASSDGSDALAKECFPMIKLIGLKENTGFCHAVNVGIKEAKTQYVLLLNNDTAVDKDFVKELERALDLEPSAFSAGAKIINMKFPEKIDDAGDFYSALGWAFARGKDKPADKYNKAGRIFAACGAAVIYRRSVFEEIGVFDENHFAYLEDIDIGYRAVIYGYKNIYEPKAVAYHAGSSVSGSRHNSFKVDLSSRNSIYLIYKNMPFLQILINLPFLLAGYLIKLLYFMRKKLGGVYLKGIIKGFLLSFSEEGRRRHVPFRLKNLPHYLWIQWELWLGIFKRI